MSKLYLQNIVRDIPFDSLPVNWLGFDFVRFSKDKTLFDFQQDALKHAIKALYLYFKEKKADKEVLFEHYKHNGFENYFDYDLDRKTAKYLLEYPEDYPIENKKISFAHFINRMSFWMATGSGKTLIIVKLIEFLGKLIAEKELPAMDILFLAHRDDLIEQFKNHIEEFNSFKFETRINLKSLRDYELVKRENHLPFAKNEITVFYYRSDLISDEQKEKFVNYKNYDNGGKWFIILDEAHKGDKEESKRQILYSILSRRGFLFNFSATFTDPRDFVTCVFNFNLAKYVEEGYGKHIYVSSSNIKAFQDQSDFSPIEKQKIVLKTLLLLTIIRNNFEEIRKINNTLYHQPLLLTLANSVDVEESDLELFFRELEKVAKNHIIADLLKEAKIELIKEFQSDTNYLFEELKWEIDSDLITRIEYRDILEYALNAKTPGNIEVLKIPGNNQELIFKLKSTDKPFALIKIGDISNWLRTKLEGYEINERFENESYFRAINRDDSDINILMGSRAFYEGWDSNRPNIILFINIGVGKDAKKFVLQSVGRGVRIEPQKNKRRRIQYLFNEKKVEEELFRRVKELVLPVESLYVFGTNANNLREIIATLREEKKEINLGDEFIVNPEAYKHLLLVPVYKPGKIFFTEENALPKYSISIDDCEIASQFYRHLGDNIAVVKYDCQVKVLEKVKESFERREQFYNFEDGRSLRDPALILRRIFDYFSIESQELDIFKKLENEIVHFKNIKYLDDERSDEIKRKIKEIRNTPEREKELEELFKQGDRKKYDQQLKLFEQAKIFEIKNQKIKIKYLASHYYLPVIISEEEKISYINHIINIPSEVKFLEEMENNLENIFSTSDWWMFSKIDHTLDQIYIPYYDPITNAFSKFHPDFIFWAQKGNRYLILFVDPKGTEHTDAYRKIDGYSKIFEVEDNGQKSCKDFPYNGIIINVKLLFRARGRIANVPENYRPYWFDNFDALTEKLENMI